MFIDLPSVTQLSDGRMQLRHGPIELIVEAFGSGMEVEAAYRQAANSFSIVLAELVEELSALRKQSGTHTNCFEGKIAIEMSKAAGMFATDHFVTPMIAVAGAVADHVLHSMTVGRALTKAYVNNGGDIAILLTKEQSFTVGVCSDLVDDTIASKAIISELSNVRGIATSGWRGRSHSLGIADSVTVVASTAATADAAATVVANAINLPNHPMIKRQAANELNPDSDLGSQMVTVDVGCLTADETICALESGKVLAQSMIDAGNITGVYASLNSKMFSLQAINAYSDSSLSRVLTLKKELASA